jgi:hypothetical protein
VYRFVPETRRRPIAIPLRLEREVADCNHFDSRSAREVGLRADVLRRDGIRTVQLAARGHAACVTIPIPFEPPVPVLLRLEYRTVVGGPARVCVWVENPGRCATLPLLRSAPGWHRLGAVITPSSGMRSLRLFLYADGGGGTTTKTEYRAITVQKARPFEMVAAAPAGALPTVTARRVSPYEIEAHVTRARRPFLLVANETYAPGWRIEARGHSSEGVEHVRVNGYANGWRIPWTGTYDVKITYGPERLAQAARRFDLVLIPLSLLLWFAWRSGAGRRGRRRLTRGAAQRADATTSP